MATLTHPKGGTIEVPDETVEFYTANGWSVPGSEPAVEPKTVEIPEGNPTDEWKVDQIDAYAEREGIEVAGKKDEKLAAIAKHLEAKA